MPYDFFLGNVVNVSHLLGSLLVFCTAAYRRQKRLIFVSKMVFCLHTITRIEDARGLFLRGAEFFWQGKTRIKTKQRQGTDRPVKSRSTNRG